jgi:hypothetical protein
VGKLGLQAVKRSNKPKPILFATGLALVVIGLLLTPGLVTALGATMGITLNIAGGSGAARIWLLKLIILTMGLPLLLYQLRASSKWRWLFDMAVGLVLLVVTLLFIEGVFSVLNRQRPPGVFKTATSYSQPYVQLDDALGYAIKPTAQITATQTTLSGELIYKLRYTISDGRRFTPLDHPHQRDQFILFFGDSFTFGDGLADDETLPAAVARAAPTYFPYNFGVSGYSPQQTLLQLQRLNLPAQVEQPDGLAIYPFICLQVNRAIGSMDVHNLWANTMPYFTLEGDTLVQQGTFESGRPLLSIVYALLGASETVKYFDLQLPRLTERHYELTARLLAESAAEFEQQFGSAEFYVMLFPGSEYCRAEFIPQLEKLNVKYLDYSTLIDPAASEMWQFDGHASARGQAVVAKKLVRDLQLDQPGAKSP